MHNKAPARCVLACASEWELMSVPSHGANSNETQEGKKPPDVEAKLRYFMFSDLEEWTYTCKTNTSKSIIPLPR